MAFAIRRGLLAATLALGLAAPAAAETFETGLEAFQDGNYETAMEVWRELADAGDPEAQINLAGMYYQGTGTEVDYMTAHTWCDIAVGLLPSGEARAAAMGLRGTVALRLSDEELAESKRRSAAWEPAD